MAKNFIQNGDMLTLTLGVAIASGQATLVGKIFGVAQGTYAADEAGEYATNGVYSITARAADTASIGAPLYWDATAKQLTTTAASNTRVGVVVNAAKLAGAEVATIKIDPAIA